VRQAVSSMLKETALDMTRLGQRMADLPMTPLPVAFQTANVQIPRPDPTAAVDMSAVISGQVAVRSQATIGPHVVLRGDTGVVDIGPNTKIGGGTVVIASSSRTDNPFAVGCIIGSNATIGSRVVLVNCRVGDKVVINDECKIGDGAMVEDGAVLEKGTVIPSGKLVPSETRWGGNPAKFMGVVEEEHH